MRGRNKPRINFFHLSRETAEDHLLDFFSRIILDRLHGNLGSGFPRVTINASRNSREGDRLTSIRLSKIQATFIARFLECRFTMQAIPINRTRSVDNKLCRQPESRSDFSLTRFASVQGDACLQKLRTRRPVNSSINTATSQK